MKSIDLHDFAQVSGLIRMCASSIYPFSEVARCVGKKAKSQMFYSESKEFAPLMLNQCSREWLNFCGRQQCQSCVLPF